MNIYQFEITTDSEHVFIKQQDGCDEDVICLHMAQVGLFIEVLRLRTHEGIDAMEKSDGTN